VIDLMIVFDFLCLMFKIVYSWKNFGVIFGF